MSEPTARRQRATYSMQFKLDLVLQSLQPGANVAQLAREHGINDNMLFTWRQRYRHLIGTLADEGSNTPVVSEDSIVPVVVEHPQSLLPTATTIPAPTLPPKSEQVCEVTIGGARLTLSGNLTPTMLATLVRELKRGRR